MRRTATLSRIAALASLLWACLGTPETTLAQQAGDAADEAFRAGGVAASEERWADSERLFRAAYEASGAPSALYNRAVALRALGRHREARDAFDRVLAEGATLLEPAELERVRALRAESASAIARIQLRGLEPGTDHRVHIDGDEHDVVGAASVELECDPGRHTLLVDREGFASQTVQLELAPGEARAVSISLEPVERRDLASEPWLWIALSVVVAGAAAGISAYLYDDAQLDPSSSAGFRL